MRRRNYVVRTRACSKISFGNLQWSADYNFCLEFLILPSSGRLKQTCEPVYYTLEQDKKSRSLRNTDRVSRGDGRRKKSKTWEWCSYQTAQVGYGKKNEERKTRLEKMIATTQLRLGPGDRERRAKKKECIWFGFDFGLRLEFCFSRNKLARPVMGTIFLVIIAIITRADRCVPEVGVSEEGVCCKIIFLWSLMIRSSKMKFFWE